MAKKYKEDRVFKILMLISLVGVIIIVTFLLIYFLGGTASSKYGNRLDELSSHIVKDSFLKDVESSIVLEKNIEKINYNLEGKLYYYTIYLKEGSKPIDGVNAATKIYEMFSDDAKGYYDFNFIVTKEKLVSDEKLPMMGSKNSTSTSIAWPKY